MYEKAFSRNGIKIWKPKFIHWYWPQRVFLPAHNFCRRNVEKSAIVKTTNEFPQCY